MSRESARVTLAAVQATPVFLDREATVDKACHLVAEAGRAGADLALFPEAFLPGYPVWVWFVPPADTRTLRQAYHRLQAASIEVPGPETERLGAAARDAGVAVAIGVNERNPEGGGGTLYNSLVYLDRQGRLAGRHRKLVPTAAERLIWGQGDGSDLAVHDLGFARVSGLICWENYMPLARYALAAWGMEVYLAPTWDRGEPWQATLRHIAKETRSYVVGCCSPMRKADVPDDLAFKEKYLGSAPEWLNPGESAIVDPDGKLLAGPAREEETILTAEVDREQLVGSRFQLDVAGHYGRPDVFELRVRRQPRPFLRLAVDGEGEPTDPPPEPV